jgi:hypothetical protein
MQSIPAKDAVQRAKESLIDLYQDDKPKALALEEIELVKDGERSLWSVTLGFHRPKSVSAVTGGSAFSLAGYGTQPAQVEHRVYKTVFIDASTGEFVKMDIRQVQ